ncbi:MAG: beta-propeller domain-containing protein [Bradymonadaceae bacterium]|nr:beta-propeller domain-containing protein [Lujinxingiaceae bacterium]
MKTRKTDIAQSWFGKPWTMTAVVLTGAALLSSACAEPGDRTGNNTTPPKTVSTEFALLPAQSCETVRERLIDATVEEVLKYRYQNYGNFFNNTADDLAQPSSPPTEAGADRDAAPDDFTETNVQEAGVDEPDIVKTDGKFIYTSHNDKLVIMKSWPADETEIVGSYKLGENIYASSLFLRGDKVAVFSTVYEYNYDYNDYDGSGKSDRDSFYGTRITILDVSDRSAPKLDRQLDIEGWMLNARMIEGKVYMVSNSQVNVPFNIWEWTNVDDDAIPAQEWDADAARLDELRNAARPVFKARISAAFAEVDVVDLLPRSRVSNSSGTVVATNPLYACTDLYLPQQVTSLGVMNISNFTLDDKSAIDSTGLLADGWLMYASKQNLYVAMSSRSWWWWWGGGSQENESHIHKFELPAGNAKPRYMASGRVDGWMLNQFSMSEHDGHLRVATTDNQWDWDEAGSERIDDGGNNLIVLKQNNNVLEETGAVRGLAPGERIYAARMMGDKGYMVTFRETDPLYTFDLSNHNSPKMLGELKIEGYSSYIHPMGDKHLLTIGVDGDENGQMSGVHLQIFDVSDMAKPTRIHHHVISTGSWSSYSEALYNHHAFTYHADKKVLAIPASIYDGGEQFTGLMIFHASADDGISEIGRVSHGDLVSQAYCHDENRDWGCSPDQGWRWWSDMRRSIFMSGDGQDFVYSLSSVGLKVNELYDPSVEIAQVLLR